jgi:DNA-directed RNA polymerase specialized sigma24 family protein
MTILDPKTLVILIEKVQQGDDKAFQQVWQALKGLATFAIKGIYVEGCDWEDKMQYAQIGVWRGCLSYRPEVAAGDPAGFLINVAAKRAVITSMLAANRLRHSPLNKAASLDAPITREDESYTLAGIVEDKGMSVEECGILKEGLGELRAILLPRLTEMEARVMGEFAPGVEYNDLAEILGLPRKTIDNALCRIRNKAKAAYAQWRAAEESPVPQCPESEPAISPESPSPPVPAAASEG